MVASLIYSFEPKITTMQSMEASEGLATKAPKCSKHRPGINETLLQLEAAVKLGTIAMLGVMASRNSRSLSLPTMKTTLRKSVRLSNA